jgi:thioredoxin 1
MKPILELNETNFDREVFHATRPVLVDFWAPWCGPCRMQAPVLEEVARERADTAVVAKVNVEDHPALAERFRIQSIPTLLYFKDGTLREQTAGLMTRKGILAKLDALQTPEAPDTPASSSHAA